MSTDLSTYHFSDEIFEDEKCLTCGARMLWSEVKDASYCPNCKEKITSDDYWAEVNFNEAMEKGELLEGEYQPEDPPDEFGED